MLKPNYQYDKRQRDLAKKKQQEEKRAKKHAKKENSDPSAVTGSDTAMPDTNVSSS
jgi:hypothetical protein